MSKSTTDDYRPLDVRKLHRAGLLTPGMAAAWNWYSRGELRFSIRVEAGADCAVLDYQAKEAGELRNLRYPVRLDWTPCQYGGVRPWFRCPMPDCGRRVAILYGGTVFACRHCRRLAYESQRARDYDRLAGRADKIRRRLGWPVGILNATPWTKPKGMHWHTFWRLTAEHNRLVGASLEGMSEHLNIVTRGMESTRRTLGRHAGALKSSGRGQTSG